MIHFMADSLTLPESQVSPNSIFKEASERRSFHFTPHNHNHLLSEFDVRLETCSNEKVPI